MDDSSLQQSEIVMLLIEAIMHDGARVPIYFNQALNSEKSVRPIQLVFQKETTQTNIDEGERMKKEVANRGNITKMFIAYVCHATMHTNCLISHILILRFLWVFDL